MELPLIGLGTWMLKGPECTQIVRKALELGYKHIDTAHAYQNHQAIAEALKGKDRSNLYITSKIAIEEQVDRKNVTASVEKACEKALQELNTDYIDLYLIHAPDRNFPLEAIYESMEKLVDQKKIVKAGVSNYTIHHLQDLNRAGFVPCANQVEFHPYLNQRALLEYCQAHHIQLISFRSFGKGKLLQEDPVFNEIGTKYQKTGAQVILRWLIQKNIPVIPKASSEKHLKENLDIFDFKLSPSEMNQLDNLNQNKRYCRAENLEYTY